MKPRKKPRLTRAHTPTGAGAVLEKVMEACAELPATGSDPAAIGVFVAESARRIFGGTASGTLVREKGVDSLASIVTAVRDGAEESALLSHAMSFATQAVDQHRLLNFRFSYRQGDAEQIYHGLAAPLSTSPSSSALLLVRRTIFTDPEIQAFNVLASIARLTLDNLDLTRSVSFQQKSVTQLLELAALANEGGLDSFLHGFVSRAAVFLGFERAFVAVIENGQCRIHWGSSNGSSSRLDIDFSSAAHRIFQTGEHVIAEEVSQLPVPERSPLLKWSPGSRQYLGVPLLAGDRRPIGILGLLDKKNKTLISPDDLHRARALAGHGAVALEGARHLQVSEQHRRRAEDLMEMALDMGSALRLPEFVKNFTERVAAMMGAKGAALG
ncbi:MAG: GAF domain-containing protein, partial [Candidatus Angelobacter sp.]